MTLPNNTHTGTGGTVFPTHLIGATEYPVGMEADQDGHIRGSLPAWGFVVPPAAVGASKTYFDIHNATTQVLRLRKLFAIVATDVAVTGTLGVRLDVFRTSSAGTGGTAFTGQSTPSASTTASAFWPFTPGNTLSASVTGRTAPTAGAASEAWLWPSYVFTEETNMSSHLPQWFNMLPDMYAGQAVELTNGKGLKVVQGTVASVGSIGFLGCFSVEG